MTATLTIPCAHCFTKNRVPEARVSDAPKCGRCKQTLLPAHPIELNDASFEQLIAASDLPVVVDFWASWCGPCRAMAPHFEEAARAELGKALFVKVNTESAPRTAARYGIRSIPTLVAFRGGKELARQSGAMTQPMIARWLSAMPG